jgi:hypothetical protein
MFYWQARRLFTLTAVMIVLFLVIRPAFAVIRDGGIDPANLGKGDWIYYMSAATNNLGGNVAGVTNETSLMQFYKSQGIRYIIIKAGTGAADFKGSYDFPQFTTTLVNQAHAAGILIFGYTRSHGTDIPGEVALVSSVFNKGADGFVFDAEGEWESRNLPNNAARAWQLCSTVRSNWPTKFLGHSPFPIISSHSTFPYKEFGYWCDAVMPQIYPGNWTNVKSRPSGAINWTDVNWYNWQNSLVGKSSTIDGVTYYWTNAIKPLAFANHVYGPNPPNESVSEVPAGYIQEFIDYLAADPHAQTKGGYQGVNFWRTDLHGQVQWGNIKAGTMGNFPGLVNNIVIDDPGATASGGWTSTRVYYNGTYTGYTGKGTGTDYDTFGTNYLTKGKGNGTAFVQFTPNILAPGNYDVYERHPTLPNASASVPHIIKYDGGSVKLSANQQRNPGQWNLLGRFNFEAGTSGSIRVTDDIAEPDAVAIVDGLKLVYVSPSALPVITNHPQSRYATIGKDVTFTVGAVHGANSFQWRFNGMNIAGATGTSYTRTNIQPAMTGNYSVLVANSLGTVVSSNAVLTIAASAAPAASREVSVQSRAPSPVTSRPAVTNLILRGPAPAY